MSARSCARLVTARVTDRHGTLISTKSASLRLTHPHLG